MRAFVKPGLTGLAQVRGFRGEARDNADIENRVACDIEYLENWNISLEWAIILRTGAQLLVDSLILHTKLTSLYLEGTKISMAGIDALKKSLPKCSILWHGRMIEPKLK